MSAITFHNVNSNIDALKPESVVNVAEAMDSSSDEQDDAIYSINDLLLERTRMIPDEPLVGYPATARGGSDYVYHTAMDLHRFADEAAKDLNKQGLPANVSFSALTTIHSDPTNIVRIPLRPKTRLSLSSVHPTWTMSPRYSPFLVWDMGSFCSQLD